MYITLYFTPFTLLSTWLEKTKLIILFVTDVKCAHKLLNTYHSKTQNLFSCSYMGTQMPYHQTKANELLCSLYA